MHLKITSVQVHISASTHHVGARARKRHELGIELQAGDRARVLPVQQSHLHAALGVPHVDLSVLGA